MEEANELKAALVLTVLLENFDRLINSFSVLEKSNLRIKPLTLISQ